MGKPRVVITGMGIISPLGTGLSANWDNVISGVSGIRKISRFDTAGYPSQIAGEISDFTPELIFFWQGHPQDGPIYPIRYGCGHRSLC